MYFIADEDVKVSDRHGNTQEFKKGVVTIAHPSIAHIAEAYGVRRCLAPVEQAEEAVPNIQAAIAGAIRRLMDAGDAKAFTADGQPKLAALRKELGITITDEQRDEAWELVKSEA